MAKVKKAQLGAKKKPASKDSVESEMFPGKMIPKSKSNYENQNISKMLSKPAPKKAAVVKKKMEKGGSLKPVDSSKNPGLAKLPTPVRNKMGYQKDGGKTKAKYGKKVVNKSKKK